MSPIPKNWLRLAATNPAMRPRLKNLLAANRPEKRMTIQLATTQPAMTRLIQSRLAMSHLPLNCRTTPIRPPTNRLAMILLATSQLARKTNFLRKIHLRRHPTEKRRSAGLEEK
jgi:hypothetical protein